MNNKIENLKAAVEELKREMAEVSVRLDQAQGDLIAAEREERRAEKLTPAMRRVLAAMSTGVQFKSSDFNYPTRYYLAHEDRASETIRKSVFQGLQSREAIDGGTKDGSLLSKVYGLTEHGRSLIAAEVNTVDDPTL